MYFFLVFKKNAKSMQSCPNSGNTISNEFSFHLTFYFNMKNATRFAGQFHETLPETWNTFSNEFPFHFTFYFNIKYATRLLKFVFFLSFQKKMPNQCNLARNRGNGFNWISFSFDFLFQYEKRNEICKPIPWNSAQYREHDFKWISFSFDFLFQYKIRNEICKPFPWNLAQYSEHGFKWISFSFDFLFQYKIRNELYNSYALQPCPKHGKRYQMNFLFIWLFISI